LSYLGWHAKWGTVQGASLDDYLIVIIRAHKECDLPRCRDRPCTTPRRRRF
jgi:hypothetical protein